MDQNYSMNMRQDNDEVEIDLMELFMVLLEKIWIIGGAAIICGLMMLVYSKFFVEPTYESTTRIIVLNTNDSDTINISDLQLGSQLMGDYQQLITSRYVVETIIETFDLDEEYEDFVKRVEVSNAANTRIIEITLTDTDPLMAKEMVDELRDVAAARIKEVMAIEAVNLVDEGNVPTKKAAPSVKKYTLIGILIGGFLSVAVILVIYLLDDTIKNAEDVEKYLHLSTLGLIPIIETEEEAAKRKRQTKVSKQDLAEEQSARRHSKDLVGLDDAENIGKAER